ncbi:hypothetical protein BKA66DRAFT_434342 [Pyrenochaeta sp. MPI-SDFR-AT-0127]|nr:hypothetical protein BKA66DRAFT_434342 [Pyrenochaeta sp. MPI-SDFR-AT-0127]
MEPFSITVGALGITDFAISSITQLRDLINGLAEAKDVVQDVASSLEAIQRPLSALESLKISDSAIYSAAKEDIMKTGVAEAVNNCGKAWNNFTKKLEQWTKHSSSTMLSLRDRLSVGVWNKEKIRTLRTQVQSCQSIVYFAVGSAQLFVQLRSEYTSKADREEVKSQLQALEGAVQEHINLTKKEQDDAQRRKDELQEEPEGEEDGGVQRTLALKEVEEQSRLLQADQDSSEVLVTQIKIHHTMQKIRDVKASEDSTALAGFINTVADPKVEQDISGVAADKRSFAGAGVIMGLVFKDVHPIQSGK